MKFSKLATFKILYKSGVKETFRSFLPKGYKEKIMREILIPSMRDNSAVYIMINNKHTIRMSDVSRITIK